MSEGVPFTDIYVDEEITEAATEVLRSRRYVKGPQAEAFETEFAAACGVENAVAVSSGTAANLLGLQALGVGEGDQVFLPGHTFFATASPVLFLGAEPVFVDIDPVTYTMDPEALREAVVAAERPRAVMPVHIYGQMAAMDRIKAIAAEFDLDVVADSCQAHLGSRDGVVAGTAADIGTFSFYPSKNMTVGGDGGMLVTDDDDIAAAARALRNHGRDEDGVHRCLGLNFRLDEVKAAVGRRQLELLPDWTRGRREAAARYDERLADVAAVEPPTEHPDARHVYHLYVIQAPDRDGLRAHLGDSGIETGIHYPTPAHEHAAVVERIGETSLQRTERLCDRIVSLPMHPRIERREIDRVCDAVQEYYA